MQLLLHIQLGFTSVFPCNCLYSQQTNSGCELTAERSVRSLRTCSVWKSAFMKELLIQAEPP